jgi:aspartate kinase
MLIVKKFGGTSLSNPERIKYIIKIIKEFSQNKSNKIVVVVSAPAGMTDKILKDLKELDDCQKNNNEIEREIDQALICGESLNAAMVSCGLNKAGIKSRSFNAFNLPIFGSKKFFDSDILEINKKKIEKYLEDGYIPVITGFQAVDFDFEDCMTLGRGGSDYSAVIFAAALNADECHIYTDVQGIFDTDPNLVSNAKKIDNMTFDEAILITSAGAKVLQEKSAIAAKKYNINLKILSSFLDFEDEKCFSKSNGTRICGNLLLERPKDEFYTTISYKKNLNHSNDSQESEYKITIIFLGSKEKLEKLKIKEIFFEKFENFLSNNQNQQIKLELDEEDLRFFFLISKDDQDFKDFLNRIYNFCDDFYKDSD